MTSSKTVTQNTLPSLDKLLNLPDCEALIDVYGRLPVRDGLREVLDELRAELYGPKGSPDISVTPTQIFNRLSELLTATHRSTLRRVFNLTGTVLHTNLGRALLPEEAVEAMIDVATGASNLEYEIDSGQRGDRDSHLEEWLCRLTGAEAATAVNNNAAAVLLVLNTFADGKEVPVSRGELIEIGGSFRVPDIMRRAGCQLVEVGTTNRTHAKDFREAISPDTGMIMKVHTSNYVVEGFTKEVAEKELAEICREAGVPFCIDLGSGTLVDFKKFGLPHEPTPAEAIAHGAELVTFSGDKLLGGPQAGLIVGKADLIRQVKKNPMKRAMRLDKVTIAALEAVLRLYADPDRLVQRLPTLRLLTRSLEEIEIVADRVRPVLEKALGSLCRIEKLPCNSQIGSGSLPVERLPSIALHIRPKKEIVGKKSGGVLDDIAEAFRNLKIPVIGRIHQGAFVLDFRCLEDDTAFVSQLDQLNLNAGS